MDLTLANLNLEGQTFEQFKIAKYYTVRYNLAKWLVHEVEGFNFKSDGLYGTQKGNFLNKLATLIEEYETSCPDFSQELEPLAKFINSHPIVFAY